MLARAFLRRVSIADAVRSAAKKAEWLFKVMRSITYLQYYNTKSRIKTAYTAKNIKFVDFILLFRSRPSARPAEYALKLLFNNRDRLLFLRLSLRLDDSGDVDILGVRPELFKIVEASCVVSEYMYNYT